MFASGYIYDNAGNFTVVKDVRLKYSGELH